MLTTLRNSSSLLRDKLNYKGPVKAVLCMMSNEASISSASSSPNLKAPGLLSIFEKNPKRLKRILFLSKLFSDANHEIRIAGGAVRDILRGVEPHDIDFATTAKPEQTLSLVQRREDILRIIVTAAGQKHGTVAVKFKENNIDTKKIKLEGEPDVNIDEQKTEISQPNHEAAKPQYDDESPFEITSLRCDVVTDGRHAEVQFVTDWSIDAERRDLTINAMFLTLDEGKLVDFHGGESDLKNGIVRFVGEAARRIQEDYLRILRFFRFWSRYNRGDDPDIETLDTIRENLSGLDSISGERLWTETKKILSHLPCHRAVALMLSLDLFSHLGLHIPNSISREDFTEQTIEQILQVQEFVGEYLRIVASRETSNETSDLELRKIKDILPVIIFATMIRNDDMLNSTHLRMRFSNMEKDTIAWIVDRKEAEVTMDYLKRQLVLARTHERPVAVLKLQALLIFKGQLDLIEKMKMWEIPEFQLSGTHVARAMKKRKLHPKLTKDILLSLKNEWADSDYSLTQDELLERMEKKLDQEVESKV